MSDLVLEKTNKANNGTELVGGTLDEDWGGNDFILQVKGETISNLPPGGVVGIRAFGFGAEAIVGTGGVKGVNHIPNGIGVNGEGGHFGVLGTGTGEKSIGVLGTGTDSGVIGATGHIGFNTDDFLHVGVGGAAFGSAEFFFGVLGESDVGVGVGGNSDGTGVLGTSTNGVGVEGVSNTHAGVIGVSFEDAGVRASGKVVGVAGEGDAGLFGQGDSLGVLGTGNQIGIFGDSASGAGVRGQTDSGIAIFGQATNPSGHAGVFGGKVSVFGSVDVLGDATVGGTKSAAVPHSDGSHRLLYTIESPESWFEDFGTAKLADGKTLVAIDPEFADLVKLDNYHVFLTPYGPSHGLYVHAQSESGFEVHENKPGSSNISFAYRIVAKRKDISGERLKKVSFPKDLIEAGQSKPSLKIRPIPTPKRPRRKSTT